MLFLRRLISFDHGQLFLFPFLFSSFSSSLRVVCGVYLGWFPFCMVLRFVWFSFFGFNRGPVLVLLFFLAPCPVGMGRVYFVHGIQFCVLLYMALSVCLHRLDVSMDILYLGIVGILLLLFLVAIFRIALHLGL